MFAGAYVSGIEFTAPPCPHLPMGISCTPDIFQARMGDMMYQLEYVKVYLDDLLVITERTFDDHLYLKEVLVFPFKGLFVN